MSVKPYPTSATVSHTHTHTHTHTHKWENGGKAETFWHRKPICTVLKHQSLGQRKAGTTVSLSSDITLDVSSVDGLGCCTCKYSPLLWLSADYPLPGCSVHGVSQQKPWNGLLLPSPGDIPNPGVETVSPASAPGKPTFWPHCILNKFLLLNEVKSVWTLIPTHPCLAQVIAENNNCLNITKSDFINENAMVWWQFWGMKVLKRAWFLQTIPS